MENERLILDGESSNRGQKATGQYRDYCPCRYNKMNRNCHFVDLDNLRAHIHEAEAGDYDEMPRFRDHVFQAYWAYIEHEAAKREGLQFWLREDARRRSHAGHVLGAREFTLTYSPQWCDDVTARKLMIRAVERIMRYYKNEMCELEVVGEITKSGQSHIHGYYLLDGGLKITDKNFKRAYKFWNPKKKLGNGHEGGHHAVVKTESDFKGYIDKDRLTAWYEFSYQREEHKDESEFTSEGVLREEGTEDGEDDYCRSETGSVSTSGKSSA